MSEEDLPDVIVLGSGASGLTAAFTAAHEGARVVVFEKNSKVGGGSAWSGGWMWLPNNPGMAESGTTDSREDAITYLTAIGRGLIPEAMIEAFVDAAPQLYTYLKDEAGLSLFSVARLPDYYPHHAGGKEAGGRTVGTDLFPYDELGDWADRVEVSPYYSPYLKMEELGIGSPVPIPPSAEEVERRKIRDERGVGSGLVGALLAACLREGVELHTSSRAMDLVMEDGRVRGVVIESEGERRTVLARRGVIIATGGFEWNEEYRKTFLRGPVHSPASIKTNTGDGLRMAMKVGAALQNMREAWWIPVTDLPEGINSMNLDMINADRARAGSIMVNRSGKRFTNEATNYNTFVGSFYEEDVNAFQYRNLPAWVVFDQNYLERFGSRGTPYDGTTPPWLTEGATLTELAEKLGIDVDEFHRTVQRWNGNVADLHDPDFHRGESAHDRWWGDPFQKGKIEGSLGVVEKGPFYALELRPGVIGTKGGPKVDVHARVVNLDGEVIPGLYAVGNASSPTGAGYGGVGGTLGPGMTFGWLAGMDAAKA